MTGACRAHLLALPYRLAMAAVAVDGMAAVEAAATGDSDSEINVKVLLQNCQRVIAERRGF